MVSLTDKVAHLHEIGFVDMFLKENPNSKKVNPDYVLDPIPEIDDLNWDKYHGVWYEFKRSKDFKFDLGDCGTSEYIMNDDGTI